MKTEAEIGMMRSSAKEAKTVERQGAASPTEPPAGTSFANTWILDFQPPYL